MAKTIEKPVWTNRIVGHAEVDPRTLAKNPKNARKHPSFQKQAMGAALDSVGWIQEVIVNQRTGRMLDGHLRVDLALSRKEVTVPVKYVDLSEEEENEVLLTFDPLGDYARTDRRLMKSLVESLEKSERPVRAELESLIEAEADSLGLFLEDMEIKEDKGGTTTTVKPGGERAYDGMPNRADIGYGPCSYKCVYCFTRASHAVTSWKGMRPRAPGDMAKEVRKAANSGRILEVGCSNDPSIVQYVNPLLELLSSCLSEKVYLVLQTKNPGYFVPHIQKTGIHPSQVTVVTSFGSLRDEVSRLLEPGTPTIPERLQGLNSLHSLGVDCQARYSPYIMGENEGLESLTESLGKFCSILCVEPLRISRTSEGTVYRHLEGLVSPDWTIAKYFDRWGLKGSNATSGNLGWYEYDHLLLRREFLRIRKLAHDHGMYFGLDDFEVTFPNCDLIDRKWPKFSPAMERFGVKFGKDSLSSMSKEGRLDPLRCDYLREVTPNTKEWYDRLNKIILYNTGLRIRVVEKSPELLLDEPPYVQP